MRIGRIEIKASRWPWQGYGWLPHRTGKGPVALLNPMGSRFGGGWNWKLGMSIGGSSVLVDLIFGSISIRQVKP